MLRAWLLVAALAGCAAPALEPVAAPPPVDWARLALWGPTEDHDHNNIAEHVGLSSSNFRTLEYDPLRAPDGTQPVEYHCSDAQWQGDRAITLVSHRRHVGTAAVTIVDVTGDPEPIAEMSFDMAMFYDVALSPDGRFALLASEIPRLPDSTTIGALPELDGGPSMSWRSGCGDGTMQLPEDTPYGPGVILVDLADPTKPAIADFLPTAGYHVHSVYMEDLDGRRMALAHPLMTGGLAAGVRVPNEQLTNTLLLEIVSGPTGPRLEMHSVLEAPPHTDRAPDTQTGHIDGLIEKHPSGKWIVTVASSDEGVHFYDVTDPTLPAYLATWSDRQEGPRTVAGDLGTGIGAMHSLLAMDQGGRHIIIVGSEIGGPPEGAPTGLTYFLDATEPAKPTVISAWTLPVEPPWGQDRASYSPHHFQREGDILFATFYHGGVWAIDASDVEAPRSVGAYIPAAIDATPTTEKPRAWGAPTVWEVHPLGEGRLLVYDLYTGLYVARFDGTHASPVDEWPVDQLLANLP